MARFESPTELIFNRGLIADPAAFADEAKAAWWLFLCGDDFAAVEGGMSYASVQTAGAESENIVAVVYHLRGAQSRSRCRRVLARADADAAPFARSDQLRARVAQGLDELARSRTASP
jgi:hypothetical protein